MRGKHTTKSVSLLFAWVAGPERPVYSFLTDAERTDGSESDRAGGLRGYRFLSQDLIVFIEIGPCRFDTLLDLIAVDLMPEMGL